MVFMIVLTVKLDQNSEFKGVTMMCELIILKNISGMAEYFTLPHLFHADSVRSPSCPRGQLRLYLDFTWTIFWLSEQLNFNS